MSLHFLPTTSVHENNAETVTFKVYFDAPYNEIRRFSLDREDCDLQTFEVQVDRIFQELAEQRRQEEGGIDAKEINIKNSSFYSDYEELNESLAPVILKYYYKDEENEWVRFNSSIEFQELFEIARKVQNIKIRVVIVKVNTQKSSQEKQTVSDEERKNYLQNLQRQQQLFVELESLASSTSSSLSGVEAASPNLQSLRSRSNQLHERIAELNQQLCRRAQQEEAHKVEETEVEQQVEEDENREENEQIETEEVVSLEESQQEQQQAGPEESELETSVILHDTPKLIIAGPSCQSHQQDLLEEIVIDSNSVLLFEDNSKQNANKPLSVELLPTVENEETGKQANSDNQETEVAAELEDEKFGMHHAILKAMGFTDLKKNQTLLEQMKGSLERVVAALLDNENDN